MAPLPVTVKHARLRHWAWLALFFCAAAASLAQESSSPSPSPSPKSVRISFVPPPLDGSISLGIYDAKGMLVRVLHREEDMDNLEIGSDALESSWDGKNDAGETLPTGKYRARGYVVGDLKVEGIGYFFNDWVNDEKSIRLTSISAIALENGLPFLSVQLSDGRALALLFDENLDVATTGEIFPRRDACAGATNLPAAVLDPIACAAGRDGTRWVIDRVAKDANETEVEQFSSSGELLRRLQIPATDPQPRQIAASPDRDVILLLEEKPQVQRLRLLKLLATKNSGEQAVSDWKVEFEKTIVAHKGFGLAQGEPAINGASPPPEKIAVKLLPNPLEKDQRRSAELAVGFDAEGSFLKTADGLPLQSISETPRLTRVVLSPTSEGGIDVFQDDDAVVEQFHLSGLEQMMAFDCGEIELK